MTDKICKCGCTTFYGSRKEDEIYRCKDCDAVYKDDEVLMNVKYICSRCGGDVKREHGLKIEYTCQVCSAKVYTLIEQPETIVKIIDMGWDY